MNCSMQFTVKEKNRTCANHSPSCPLLATGTTSTHHSNHSKKRFYIFIHPRRVHHYIIQKKNAGLQFNFGFLALFASKASSHCFRCHSEYIEMMLPLECLYQELFMHFPLSLFLTFPFQLCSAVTPQLFLEGSVEHDCCGKSLLAFRGGGFLHAL